MPPTSPPDSTVLYNPLTAPQQEMVQVGMSECLPAPCLVETADLPC